MDGDLTILAGDPASAGLLTMADIKYTVRHGKVIYPAPAAP
jgi:hypothetical protein